MSTYATSHEVLLAVQQGAITLEQASALLSSLSAEKPKGKIWAKISEKGALSVYGLMRFPVTLYVEQWERLLDWQEELRANMKLPGLKRETEAEKAQRRAEAKAKQPAKPAPAPAPAAPPKVPAALAARLGKSPTQQAYVELPNQGCYVGPFPSTAAAGEYAQAIPEDSRVVTALPSSAGPDDVAPPDAFRAAFPELFAAAA